MEIATGLPPGAAPGTAARPGFDPNTTSQTDRLRAKAAELGISARTIGRKRVRFEAQGLWGLVDQRAARTFDEHAGRRHGLFRSDWCYGTPGLLLARLAVPGGAEDDVRIALRETRLAAQRFPAHGYATGTCHGAAGLAEVLSLVPPDLREPHDHALAGHLTEIAVAAADPTDPGLMMGVAGAACAALRRHCDTTVSAALPLPAPGGTT